MKKRNIDTIKIEVIPGKGLSSYFGATIKDGVEYVHHVYINDKHIWSDGVEIYEFENMLTAPGDYWPFCCSYCGEPGCNGILTPVRCFHKGDDQLVLVIREPLQDNCYICDLYEGGCKAKSSDPEYIDCPHRRGLYHAYCIEKESLRRQLLALHEKFGDRLGKS